MYSLGSLGTISEAIINRYSKNAPPHFLEFNTFLDIVVCQNRVKLKVSRKVRRFWNKKKSRKTEIRVTRTRVKRGMPVFLNLFSVYRVAEF